MSKIQDFLPQNKLIWNKSKSNFISFNRNENRNKPTIIDNENTEQIGHIHVVGISQVNDLVLITS